jgi:alkanesulfonate monooxygenase SsuD/methylene tetrahydromethanopterin reductase-like flavin-dependent oxidoreductase (luciferase family)
MAAEGPKSMKRAGLYGDGLITDAKRALMPEMRQAFEQGAREAGKDPARMPILAELFVCTGDKEEAARTAQLWRFTPRAWSEYVNNPDPRDIQHRAEREVPLEEAYKDWPIGNDPEVHVQAIKKLIDGGVTHVFVHSAQRDQASVIEFYGRQVLPRLR